MPLWVAVCGSGVQISLLEIILVSGLNNPIIWENQYGYLTEKANESSGEFNEKLVLLTFSSITVGKEGDSLIHVTGSARSCWTGVVISIKYPSCHWCWFFYLWAWFHSFAAIAVSVPVTLCCGGRHCTPSNIGNKYSVSLIPTVQFHGALWVVVLSSWAAFNSQQSVTDAVPPFHGRRRLRLHICSHFTDLIMSPYRSFCWQ